MTMNLLDEGTSKLSSQEIAETEERLGADVSTQNGGDRSYVMLNALSPNLAPSLDLMRDVVKDAAFRPDDIDRMRAQVLTGIAQQQKDPQRVAHRLLPQVLYGANHPYGGPPSGDPKAIAKFTRDDLIAFERALAAARQCKALHRLGSSAVPRFSRCSRRVSDNGRHRQVRRASRISRRSRRGRLRRRSCSSIGRARRNRRIVGGELLPIDPRADIVPFDTANDVLGGTFLSRLNMDLRESKGWSYGVNGD